MKKLIVITLIALTAAGCPSKDKNQGTATGVIHPNNISNTCMNTYYNPQTGQLTTYNPYNGAVVSTSNVGYNYQWACGGYPTGGLGYGVYTASPYAWSSGWQYGFGCGSGYIAVYGSYYGAGCLQASYLSQFNWYTNALVYNYAFSGGALSWNFAGYYGGLYGAGGFGFSPYSAVMSCVDNSYCRCAKLNSYWGICTQ